MVVEQSTPSPVEPQPEVATPDTLEKFTIKMLTNSTWFGKLARQCWIASAAIGGDYPGAVVGYQILRSVLAEDVEQVKWGKDEDESSNGDSEAEEESEPQPKKPKVANEKKRC